MLEILNSHESDVAMFFFFTFFFVLQQAVLQVLYTHVSLQCIPFMSWRGAVCGCVFVWGSVLLLALLQTRRMSFLGRGWRICGKSAVQQNNSLFFLLIAGHCTYLLTTQLRLYRNGCFFFKKIVIVYGYGYRSGLVGLG